MSMSPCSKLLFRRSKTLLKKSKKVSKLPSDNIKLEEQFNFMTKFNLDVRERNKAKILKVQKYKNKKMIKKTKEDIFNIFVVLFLIEFH